MAILELENIPEVKKLNGWAQQKNGGQTEEKKKSVNLEDRIIGIIQSKQQRENR